MTPHEQLAARVERCLDALLPKLSRRRTKTLLRLDGVALIRRLRSEIRRTKTCVRFDG